MLRLLSLFLSCALAITLAAGASAQDSGGSPTPPKTAPQKEKQQREYNVGKDGLLKIEGKVAMDDAKVKIPVGPKKNLDLLAKRFLVKLEGGKRYELTLRSLAIDSVLLVQDAAGKNLAADDNSGGGLDSWMEYHAPQDAVYQIFAAARAKSGSFELRVRELKGAGKLTGAQRKELEGKRNKLNAALVAASRKGQLLQAVALAQESLATNKLLFPGDDYPDGHTSLARSLNNLAFLLQAQGKLADAEPLYRAALAMRQRLFQRDHPDLATSLNNLALLLRAQGKLADAETLCRAALAMRQRLFQGDHPDLALSLNNLAGLLQAQGKLANAETLYRDSLAMKKRLFQGDHLELALSLNNLAGLLEAQGKLADAEILYRDSLAMKKRLFKGDHPDLARSLHNLAFLLQAQGKLADAEPLFRAALAMRQQLFQGDHPDLASSLNNLASLLRAQGKLADAETLCRDSLAMRQRLFKGDHPDLALTLNDLAALLQAQGKLADAETLCRDSLAMKKRLFKGDHPELAMSLNNLAFLLQAQGKLADAVPFCRDALAMYKRLFQEDHPDLARSLINLAGLLQAQGKLADAETLCCDALAMYRRLANNFAALKSEGEALMYLGRLPWARDIFLSIGRLSRSAPAATYTELWHAKASLARVYERRALAVRTGAVDPKVASLLASLTESRRRRAEILLAKLPENPETRQERDRELRAVEKRITEVERELRLLLPALRADKLAKANPIDLQKLLPADTAVVDYLGYTFFEYDKDKPGRAGEKRTPSYLAFVVTKDRIACVELGAAAYLEKVVRLWREAITGPGMEVHGDLPRKVRELVWDKVRKELPAHIKTVYIAPDLALTAVPWAALPGDRKGTILLEDYALAVIPHAPFLLEQLWPEAPASKRPSGVLVVGGVKFDAKVPLAAKPAFMASREAPLKADEKLNWRYLNGAEAEAKGLQALAKSRKLGSTLLSGDQANAAAVLAALPQARFAHFATHGFFADKEFRSVLQVDPKLFEMRGLERVGSGALSPMVLSGLVFAGANLPETPGRGLVTGESLIDRNLCGLDLAVLSACETGLGDVAGGEGVFGLQRAFHVAGARNVAASLWKVDDNATAALMAVFYRELWEKNQPPIEALRRAQLEIYRNPGKIPELAKGWRSGFDVVAGKGKLPPPATDAAGHAHPRQWAAFTLSGPGTLRK